MRTTWTDFTCFSRVLVFVLLGNGLCWSQAADAEWPQWRGPDGSGISNDANWNRHALQERPRIAWTADVGSGYSNVVIKDDRLYAVGRKLLDDQILCLDARTGSQLWRQPLGHASKAFQSTPVTDGQLLYALDPEGLLYCLKARDGALVWKKDLAEEDGVIRPYHCFGGSPIREGDLLLLTANTSGIALNAMTGDLVWTSAAPPRDVKTRDADTTGVDYSTPVVYSHAGRRCAVLSSWRGIQSVDVTTGQILWSYPWQLYSGVQTADPVLCGDTVFVSQAPFPELSCFLLDIGSGAPKLLWRNQNLCSYLSTAIVIKGYLYGSVGGPQTGVAARLRCIDLRTGDVKWEKSWGKANSMALTAAAETLIILEENGTLHFAKASPASYEEISRCDVLRDAKQPRQFWASPVLYRSRIYCRDLDGDLVCVDVSK